MPRGKKTSPEVVYQVMASWVITNNLKETARALHMPVTTVKKIVDENKDKPEFVRLCEESRAAFAAEASRIMMKALSRLEKDIDNPAKNIPVNHLTTVIGTLYDKIALSEGTATDNVTVQIKLPEGMEEYAG